MGPTFRRRGVLALTIWRLLFHRLHRLALSFDAGILIVVAVETFGYKGHKQKQLCATLKKVFTLQMLGGFTVESKRL